MDIKAAIAKVVDRKDLTTEEMIEVMQQIMTGQATPAQIGGFLMALRFKSESVGEITGAAQVMRQLASKVDIDDPHLVDTCGTGGDGSNLFNVSTAAAFVVAAAGGKVAKHGNRSVSSRSGSADVLEAAGINLDMSTEQVARAIKEIGVGFLFAPAHHSAMKHAIGPRREMGIRTIFNMLGPLTNPAGVTKQVIGVFNPLLCLPLAEVLQRLGSTHVLVVSAADGLDEISLACETHVAELKDGKISEYTLTPEDAGIMRRSLDGLTVTSAEESLKLIEAALTKATDQTSQKARDIVALNAGAAIYAADLARSFQEGVEMAQDAIGSGLAFAKLKELASFSACFKEEE
ncbi:anthranilate phosphoribosyltransferase [Hahella sp. KA22]|uniref:anthranilate phosphoribosyltransferase n=1 Tax=Hahella sp. KA22 TaxID=1628392 RepID=UPI000FDD8C38|nr:anthranilate phosphoribosyltransferase [Hahella sp. KA22]AZZ94537.1 anthranilate phosphoribosyltransferase [Hahella sp. KA22]QAY57910.1 anthranilate phosphoribosyltransferase [Hahella sp. KA22]